MLNWNEYIVIADRFQGKVPYQDRDDIRQEIVLRLAEVDAKRNGNGPMTEAGMIRTASYVIKEYWRDLKRKPTILSLNNGHDDENGHTHEFWETLADDTAIDLEAWLDANMWLLSCPQRLIEIAHKRVDGIALNDKERQYLKRYRPKAKQLALA